MGPYVWAWIIVVVAAPLALYALLRATRGMPLAATRHGLAWLVAVWLLLPAPVPNFPGHYAPAFLVFGFELLFQQAGDPRPAGLILAVGSALTLVVLLLWALVRGRAKRNSVSGSAT
ncbi:MAG: hypothetical protein ACNA7W_13905 [Pseudomonadales bacterium]